MKLDPATIILMSTVMAIAMSVVVFAAQRSFPRSVQGLREWVIGLLALIVASVLFALNGKVWPDLLLPVANSVFLWGAGMQMIGTQIFYGERPSWRLFHLVWLSGLLVMLVWLYWMPNFSMRVAMYSFLMALLSFRQLISIVRHGERHVSSCFFAALTLLLSLALLHRGSAALQIGGAGFDILHGGPNHSLYLAVLSFMTLLLPVGFMTVATRRLQWVLEQRSNLDPLTNVLNRRGFADLHARESARLQRSGRPLALMSIDLDFFKAINDTYGHGVGDLVLVDVAQIITAALREGDVVARFGGEEFIVLLPGAQLECAKRVAQRIRQALRQPRAGQNLPPYTVSIGIAYQNGNTEALDTLLLRSDRALYCAKRLGRDRIEVDDGSPLTEAATSIWQ